MRLRPGHLALWFFDRLGRDRWWLGRSDRVEARRVDTDRRRRNSQTEFVETLQLVQIEDDAHALDQRT
jgi:hypothetical protein